METTTAIITLVSLSGILLVLGRLRACAVDHFRQSVFALRDGLFDHAASGAIGFDHPAYGMLRTTMNGFVRWADQLRLPEVLVLIAFIRRTGWMTAVDFENRWNRALADLQQDERERLRSYRERLHRLLVGYLVFGSPVFVAALIIPLIIALMVRLVWFLAKDFRFTAVKRSLGLLNAPLGKVDAVDARALEMGSDKRPVSSLPGLPTPFPA